MVAATPMARNDVKYFPIGDCANAWTELTMPERVIIVPKMHKKKEEATSTAFHTFIMPFFSCIMTECKYAVALNQGSSEAFSTGSQAQYPPQPRAAYAQLAPISTPTPWNS